MDVRTHTVLPAYMRFEQYCYDTLHASLRVNVTSERIPTHPGIQVKSGN